VIPFVDLKAQMRTIRAEVDAAIGRVLDSCHFTLGPEVAAFESEFAELCRRQEGVAVNTGTSALHLALLAAGIGPGDEVVTVPFTFVATVSAIDYTGARPVFVDIDPATLTMDPQALEAAITPRTRAIMPVHLYGMTADMDPILAVARRHGLLVIEDAAQAHAAAYRGRPAGSPGRHGLLQLLPGQDAGRLRRRRHGGDRRPELGAAPAHAARLGRGAEVPPRRQGLQLPHGGHPGCGAAGQAAAPAGLDRGPAPRRGRLRRAAGRLRAAGAGRAGRPAPRGTTSTPCAAPRARAWQQALLQQGIHTNIHYPTPVHLLPAFAELGGRPGQFPHAEAAAREVLSLPLYPELTASRWRASGMPCGCWPGWRRRQARRSARRRARWPRHWPACAMPQHEGTGAMSGTAAGARRPAGAA
jgi:hypothetical protein